MENSALIKLVLVRCTAVIALLFINTPVNTILADERCGTKAVSGINNWVKSIKEYQLKSHVDIKNINDSTIEATIVGQLPNKLIVNLSIKGNNSSVQQKVVFDGEYQWIESKSSLGVESFKISLDKLTNSNRPFDTFYYLMGTGLFSGEDFPGTIETLLTIYNYKKKCININDGSVVISGAINSAKFTEYVMSSKHGKYRKSGIDTFISKFGHVKITINPETYAVDGYSLGPDENNIELEIKYSDMQINQKLPEKYFKYFEPKGAKTIDITDVVLKQLR